MQQITLTTQSIPKPAGRAAGNWHIALKNAAGVVTHNYIGPLPSTTFQDVPNGDYTINAARLDVFGDPFAPPVTRAFTVTDGELVDVPISILVGGA